MDVNSRHAAGQLLHSGAVVEGEVPGRDGDAAEAERQSDRDRVCRRGGGRGAKKKTTTRLHHGPGRGRLGKIFGQA